MNQTTPDTWSARRVLAGLSALGAVVLLTFPFWWSARRVLAGVSALGAVVLLTFPFWGSWNAVDASTRVVTGWAMPNDVGTAISFHDSPAATASEGYIIAGAPWWGTGNVHHGGADFPTCVGTDTASFTHVSLGLVTVEIPDGGTNVRVAWLECLE